MTSSGRVPRLAKIVSGVSWHEDAQVPGSSDGLRSADPGAASPDAPANADRHADRQEDGEEAVMDVAASCAVGEEVVESSRGDAGRTVDQVIDGMGFGRYQVWLLCLCGAGWAADILDVQAVAYLIPALIKDWGETRANLGLAASFTFVGMLLGSLFWGVMSDRLGRRPAFALTSLCAGVAGMLASTSHNVSILVFWRLIQGFGLGGNLAVDFSLFMEFVPTNARGSASTLLTIFATFGSMTAALLAWLFVDPALGSGWRPFLLCCAAPGVLIAALRSRMLESPHFLASCGRFDEAEQVLRSVAAYNGVTLPAALCVRHPLKPIQALGLQQELAQVLKRLTDAHLGPRMAATSLMWFALSFGFYGFNVWGPSYFLARGFSPQRSYEALFSSVACQIPGSLSAAYLVERTGRRPLLVAFSMGCCLAISGFAISTSQAAMVGCSLVLNFNTAALWAVTYTFTPEIFPTALRTSAMGVCSAIARISGILTSYLGMPR